MQSMMKSVSGNRPASLGRGRAMNASPSKALVCRAQAEKSPLAKFSDGIGMPTEDGIFGFTPFAEQWVGRWAMLGFASSIVGEVNTGVGALGQLGIATPSTPVLTALIALSVVATAAGTVLTGQKAMGNNMSRREIARYKSFLRLNSGEDAEAEARRMKQKGDFTTISDDAGAIAAAKAQGAPVDAFLSTDNSSAEAASSSMKAQERRGDSEPESRKVAQLEMYPGEANDLAYARNVEITNGRWAMIGFLASILVEAGTGYGILGQVVLYLKASGVLGAKSGF